MNVTNTCFDMSGSRKDLCFSVYHDCDIDNKDEEHNTFNGNSEVLLNMLHPTTPSSAADFLELVEEYFPETPTSTGLFPELSDLVRVQESDANVVVEEYFPETSTSTELFPELSDLVRVQESDANVVNLSEQETLVSSDIEPSTTIFTFSNIPCINAEKGNESNDLVGNKLVTNEINNDNEVDASASSTLGMTASPSQGKYFTKKMNKTMKCPLSGTENKNRSSARFPHEVSCVRDEAGKESLSKISEWSNIMDHSVSGVIKPVVIKMTTNFRPGVQLIGNDNIKKCVRSSTAEVLSEGCYGPTLIGEDLESSKISSSCSFNRFNFSNKSENVAFKVGANLAHKINFVQKCSLEPNYILKTLGSGYNGKFMNSVNSFADDTSKSDDSDNSSFNFENCNLNGQSESKVSDLSDLPCLSKNAIAARENRKKKKKYIEQLENSVKNLTKNNNNLNQNVKEMKEVIVNLTNEVSYLRGVIANIEEISTLIKGIKNIPGLNFNCSLQKKRSCCLDNSCEEPKAKQSKTEEVKKKLVKPPLHYGATIKKHQACGEDSEQTSGVCLHVSNKCVSLEFCPSCNHSANITGPGDVYQEI
ncbi:uncharacterized protein LOC106472156 isoform X2 [Limulus polyphemus]|uniref:Uncharacterized protein LOC106472156 isoform X2 n=1 Tax=Limulus polyphemus TaxID=6850 RepID=A0ABM1TKQ3_LIMPO|nr:uncharacterized protein LOC106472156 isoform X2 [Limulus polyphemus]